MTDKQMITVDPAELDKLVNNSARAMLKMAEKRMVEIGVQTANKRAWLMLGLGFAAGLNTAALIILLVLRYYGVL